jgi:deazaflavin-dependent oxidoreductase (nitroreductase family)
MAVVPTGQRQVLPNRPTIGGVPLSKRIARLNKIGLNRLTIKLGPWMPGFGVVTHHGRKSGKEYRIPVNVFRRGSGFLFCLTYGKDADWVRNVLAAGNCGLLTGRRDFSLTNPRLEHHEQSMPDLPWFVRTVLRLTGVHDYLRLDVDGTPQAPGSGVVPDEA